MSLTKSPFPPIADYGFLSDCHAVEQVPVDAGRVERADAQPVNRPVRGDECPDDTAHLLVGTVECLEGTVGVELVCEPAFDYGRVEATWRLADTGGHQADASPATLAEWSAHVDATVAFWRSWLARARIPDHSLRHPLERSAVTIKYAEEFEVERARHLGNFPQAFSHLALIVAAGRIILSDFRRELPL